jgi:hypothetical protein
MGAQQNLGLGLMLYEHRLADALPHFQAVATSNHPMRGLSWYCIGMIYTELGNYREAAAAIEKGRKLGALGGHFEDVSPDLALRNYPAVLARLNSSPTALPASMQAEKQVRFAAVALDQANDSQARVYLNKAAQDALQTPSKTQQARINLAETALDLATNWPNAKKELADLIKDEIDRAESAGPATDGSPAIHLALAAMLAARNNEPTLSRKALDAARDMALDHGYYDRAALWKTADCETQFAASPKDRVACLSKLLDGREYFQTHVALELAYRADHDATNERAQTRWLQTHRGQAVIELPDEPALIPNLLALRGN